MTRYVAIDTETTGLDVERDEVVEIGAVAFDLESALDTYHTFVRPARALPYHVQRLTGIDPSLLESAPRMSSIASELREFIGGSAIIGQNAAFDLAFLDRAGIHPSGPVYDTLDLAQLVVPTAGEFSLRALAALLGVEFPVRHRALEDANATRSVFVALLRRLGELPPWLLQDIERLALAGEWQLAALVREALAAKTGPDGGGLTVMDAIARPLELPRPLSRSEGACEVDPEDALRCLSLAAKLTDVFPEFERRVEQEQMAVAVTNALNGAHHLVVEAGTGTGKSLAYLLPAALHAVRNRDRVLVSTDTIGLQEQLTGKDLPVVQRLLSEAGEEVPRVAQLKGRRNYLCLQRWNAVRHAMPASKEEARLHARLLVWLTQTQTGDRAELNLHSSFDGAWSRLSAENTGCSQGACAFAREGTCFMQRARRRAEAAHVVVVNHALLLSDVAMQGRVLPPYSRLVIDEAHNLEDEATSRLSFRASEGDLGTLLERVGRRSTDRSGVVGALSDALRGSERILGPGAYLAGIGSALAAASGRARQRLSLPFKLLAGVLRDHGRSESDRDDRLLLTRAIRVQPAWSDVQIAAEDLEAALSDVQSLLDDLRTALDSGDLDLGAQEALLAETQDLSQTVVNIRSGLNAALLAEDPSLICWLERSRSTGEVTVCSAPLQVADLLRTQLFDSKETAVLTSATLSAQGRFDYLRERVGLEDAEELLLGSPFDYQRSTLIVLPRDMPEPNDYEFAASAAELLIESCRAAGGRTLVLFTSYGALNAAYDSVKPALESEGILVLAHGSDGSPRQLLAALRENPRTVILGTASFWEGVDVAGDALSLLVIARLPFAVPTDPIYQARSSLYDDPFEEYALPQAVLRFRQGFGRLIRTRTDRGVLLVLDRRIGSRKYGEAFLRSLPRCSVRELPSREVAGAIESWLR